MLKPMIKTLCALCLVISYAQAYADAGVCGTASIINPNTMDGGMGGTGNAGGAGGTGIIATGGVGGTGISGGTGGTGTVAEGGAGGTGILADSALLPESGVGGIAIVGVVTGFASICVNGEEVFYSNNTPVFDNGNAAKLSSLAAGQMVMLKVDNVNGQLRARAIGMFDAVAGPIDKLDIKNQQIEVMGQTVQLDQLTMQQLRTLEPGTTVRVSGHRLENGQIVATRVSVTGKAGLANTLGMVTSVAGDGFAINGTKVSFDRNSIDDKAILNKIKVGSEVRVGGAWNGSAIKASRIEAQPIISLMSRSDTAIMEGFARLNGVNGISIAGTEVVLSQVKSSYKNIANSHGKVVKMEIHRDGSNWVCDKLDERKGKLFDRHGHFNNERDDNQNRGGDDNSGSGSSNSGRRSSEGSDSNSGSNAGSGSSDFGRDSDSLELNAGRGSPGSSGAMGGSSRSGGGVSGGGSSGGGSSGGTSGGSSGGGTSGGGSSGGTSSGGGSGNSGSGKSK